MFEMMFEMMFEILICAVIVGGVVTLSLIGVVGAMELINRRKNR